MLRVQFDMGGDLEDEGFKAVANCAGNEANANCHLDGALG